MMRMLERFEWTRARPGSYGEHGDRDGGEDRELGLTERLVHLADADCGLCELAGERVCVDIDIDVVLVLVLDDGRRKRVGVNGLGEADIGARVLLLGEPVLERCAAFEVGVYKAGAGQATEHLLLVVLLPVERAGDRLLLDIWDRVGVSDGDEDGWLAVGRPLQDNVRPDEGLDDTLCC
jgi:hypothetical protein